MKKLLLLLIPLIVLLIGCQKAEVPKENVTVCEPPYMNVADYCCLDANNNSICDEYEPPAPKNDTSSPKSSPVLLNQKPEEVKYCNISYAINWATAKNNCQVNGTKVTAILMYSGKGNGIEGMWFYATTETGTEKYIKDDVGFAKAEARQYIININEPLVKLIALPMITENGTQKACLNQRMIVIGSGVC